MRRNFAVPELFLEDSARDPGRLPHLAEGERAADDDQTPRIDFANFIKNLATIVPQSEPLSPEDWDKRLCALWTTTINGERYTLALYTTSGLAQFTLNVLLMAVVHGRCLRAVAACRCGGGFPVGDRQGHPGNMPPARTALHPWCISGICGLYD